MMTELKLLAATNSVPTSKTTAYTVPDGKAVTVKAISMVNANGSARTTNVYLKASGGSSVRIWELNFSIATGIQELQQVSWCLSAGDEIEWDASGADVHGVISGIVVQAQ